MNKLYVHFYHGRNTVDEEMNDWGFDGMVVNVDAIVWTYGNIRLINEKGYDIDLKIVDDVIEIAGKYYGDFTIYTDENEINNINILSFEEFSKLK